MGTAKIRLAIHCAEVKLARACPAACRDYQTKRVPDAGALHWTGQYKSLRKGRPPPDLNHGRRIFPGS